MVVVLGLPLSSVVTVVRCFSPSEAQIFSFRLLVCLVSVIAGDVSCVSMSCILRSRI